MPLASPCVSSGVRFVRRLPDFLSWTGDPSHWIRIESIRREFNERMLAAVRGFLSSLRSDSIAAFDSLPEANRLRIATAPSTFRVLSPEYDRALGDKKDFFSSVIDAEAGTTGGRPKAGARLWTALGDRRIDEEGSSAAPRLFDRGIAVDFDSPYARFQPPMDQESEAGDDTRQEILSHLETAWRRLNDRETGAAVFVGMFTRVVCPRIRTSRRSGMSSSSWSNEIGKCGLSFPHDSNVEPDAILSCLIHESVHSMLYMIEAGEPTYRLPDRSHRIVSPWTGRALPVSSATHACFVWYALWSFWTLLPAGSSPERESAAGGFRPERWRPFFAQLRPHLTSESGAAVAELRARFEMSTPAPGRP